jgi:multidrug efflux pump subunit AcrB
MSEHTEPTAPGAIAWMTSNTVAANLLMIIILVGGLIALLNVKQEVFPEFDLDVVSVTVPYPGASPAEVEQGIVLAVEEAVRGVDGVKKVTSKSFEGAGSVTVEAIIGADPDKLLQDVKNEVDRIQTFPEEAEDPQVQLVSRKTKVVGLILSGDQELSTLHGIAERARVELLARGGVTQVELDGIPPLEMRVEVSRDTLAAYGLTLDDVSRQIGLSSLELPGGDIDAKSGDILVRVSDRKRTADELADIVIRGTRNGAEVRLGDIATVHDGFEDNDQEMRFDGKPAVMLTAYRVGNESPQGVSDAVNGYLPDLRSELPPEVSVSVWDDDSELLRDRIDLLVRNARSGLVLVLLVLWLFLDLRLAFWVALGIPISFMGAFFLMPTMGVSVNMISLFALIITLGLVVDDAIVVGENVYEKVEMGLSPLEAATEGAREMAVPVTFAILTTAAAFAPMLFVPGTTGKIFRIIPLVVLFVLFFSLIESFFVLPAHLSHQGDLPPIIQRFIDAIDRPRQVVSGALKRFTEGPYERMVRWFIDNRYAGIAGSMALFMLAVGTVASGIVPFSFLPKTEADLIRASARLPYGVPVEQTERVRAELELALDRALEKVEGGDEAVLGRLATLGMGPAQDGPGAGSRDVGSHLMSLEIDLVGTEDRTFTTNELSQLWQAELPVMAGIESLSFTSSIGPSGGAAVQVQLAHVDTEVLAAASQEVTDRLREYPSLANVDNGYAAGKPQLDFRLLDEARSLGLTSTDIARQVRSAFFGSEAVREQRGRNELKIMVRPPEDERLSEYDLEQLDIRTPGGAWVPLQSVAIAERGKAATSINRESGRRVVDVKAEMAVGEKTVQPVLADLSANYLGELEDKYPGLTARFAGEQESQNESLASLGQNYFMALFAIFALLAVPFRSYVQPLVIMSAIPFGVVGAIAGHLVMGYELSIISVMGIVALSGVVVNDSLVLVDASNRYRREGLSPLEAIVKAGKRRIRPILLTSLTTFFGLLPMIFEPSVQARFLIPMAISLGYGVLFVTVIVLLLVPALYMITEDLKWFVDWALAPWVAQDPGDTPDSAPAK